MRHQRSRAGSTGSADAKTTTPAPPARTWTSLLRWVAPALGPTLAWAGAGPALRAFGIAHVLWFHLVTAWVQWPASVAVLPLALRAPARLTATVKAAKAANAASAANAAKAANAAEAQPRPRPHPTTRSRKPPAQWHCRPLCSTRPSEAKTRGSQRRALSAHPLPVLLAAVRACNCVLPATTVGTQRPRRVVLGPACADGQGVCSRPDRARLRGARVSGRCGSVACVAPALPGVPGHSCSVWCSWLQSPAMGHPSGESRGWRE